MGYSANWDQRYQQNTHMTVWPFSDLISFTMRYARPSGHGFKVLELGCGVGANIPFFLAQGAEFYAVDGSQFSVDQLHERYPNLKNNIIVGDFTQKLDFPVEFDLVVDRGSLTCNHTAGIAACIELVHQKLKPGGKFIGIDWLSTEYPMFLKGSPAEDEYTRRDYKTGPYVDVGRVHYADKPLILKLFKGFEIRVLEHKVTTRDTPDDGWKQASWNFVAQKI